MRSDDRSEHPDLRSSSPCRALAGGRCVPAAPPTEAERLLGLARLWKEADYSFVFFDHVPELDWDAAFAAYAPQVSQAKDTFAYYRLLQRFSALLKDGHTGVQLPRELEMSRFVDVPPVWLEAVGRRALVTDVEAGLEARLPIGSELLSRGRRHDRAPAA